MTLTAFYFLFSNTATNKTVLEFRPELQLLTDLGEFIHTKLVLGTSLPAAHPASLARGHVVPIETLIVSDYVFSGEIPTWIGMLSNLGKF